jgi:DNA-binding CsgD family transcriptional regulator
VSSPHSLPGRAADLVTALYGLTQAEGRVFDAIAQGRPPQEAAAALGVSRSTLKTHLLRVFAKVGVHRQADLVRLSVALDSSITVR